MAQNGAEQAGLNEIDEHRDRPGGYTDMIDNALVAERDQRLHRAALPHRLGESHVVLGIVEMHELDAIKAQPRQTLLRRAAHAGARKILRHLVGIHLGGQHEPPGQAAGFADGGTDAALGRAVVAVAVRRVHEIERAGEDRAQRRRRGLVIDGIAVEGPARWPADWCRCRSRSPQVRCRQAGASPTNPSPWLQNLSGILSVAPSATVMNFT